MNWDNYKFHCSGLKNLMVNPRLKSETLSETTKNYLDEIFIKEVFHREKTDMIANKYVRKGVMCEPDSFKLVEDVTKEVYFKNQATLENDFVVGTPDIQAPEKIIDIKTSWDLFTFFKVDRDQAESDYYYQLLGYMMLTGKKKADLIYCLVDTPEELINDELHRLNFYMNEDEAKSYRINYVYGDIPAEAKIKRFEFDYDEEVAEKLKERIVLAREYLAGLSI